MAPKGNKNAVGNQGGRPRTITPPKEDLIKLGEELVQWAKEPTDELRCRFCQWYSIEKNILDSEWDLMTRKPEFIGYYEQARASLGQRYVDGSVNPSIAHRLLRVYIPEVKKDETAQKQQDFDFKKLLIELELKMKSDAMDLVPEEIKSQYTSLIAQISSLQSARKIDDNKIKTDNKS